MIVRILCAITALLFVSPALADQDDPALQGLYEQLVDAPDGAQASVIEARIWEVWLQAPDQSSSELLRKTTDAMSQRDFREALIVSTQLINDYPEYSEGWNKRATVHYLMGNYDASVADIQETLKREPRHFGAISGIGLIFHRTGKLEAALSAFEQVLQISPQSLTRSAALMS